MSRRFVMVMLLVLVVGLVRPVGAQTDDIDRAREESERARDLVFAAQAEVDAALDRIADAQFRADEATARFWEAQSALYALDEEIAALDAEIAARTAELDELRAEVREIAIDAYIETGQIPSVFESSDINEHALNEALARFATDTRRDVIDEFRIARDELASSQDELAARRSEQEAAIGTADEARAEIDSELAELQREHDVLEEAVAAREAILADFEAEERRLIEEELARQAAEEARRRAEEEAARRAAEAEAARIAAEQEAARIAAEQEAARQAALNGETPDATGDDGAPVSGDAGGAPAAPSPVMPTGWACPLAGPFSHVDDFWAPRTYGGVHRANDLLAETGTPVIAVVGGQADFRGGSISGLAVRIDGDDGDWYFYGHLSAYESPDRTYVEQGSVIGYVGMTGNAPIPHLHFEWHDGGYGNYANPYPVIAATC